MPLAASLYVAVTGEAPPGSWERLDDADPLRAPSGLGVALSPGFETALLRALAVDVASRTSTMSGFAADLRTGVDSGDVAP